ncbi:MAG: type VI secretion system baseplate subunit TssG [Planctomycetota bacterium]
MMRRLEEKPWGFDFFRAVRRLEAAYPDKPPFGTSLRLSDDPVRFAQEPSLAFAPRSLASFRREKDGKPPRLTVFFFGLFGPNGALPHHLTEYARSRLRNEGDDTFSRFLDIFHHRMLALFYRVWANAQPVVSLDRPGDNRWTRIVGALCGMGTPACWGRDALPDHFKLYYSGQLASQSRHPDGLRSMLSGFFGLPVDINEFVGQWLELPDSSRLRLGETPETGTLGDSTLVGSRMWECQLKFRIRLGPMGYDDFRRLLPSSGGDSIRRLIAVVRNYIGEELDWDVNLVLSKEEVPPVTLGQEGRLGLTSWLRGQPMESDADDLILDVLRASA